MPPILFLSNQSMNVGFQASYPFKTYRRAGLDVCLLSDSEINAAEYRFGSEGVCRMTFVTTLSKVCPRPSKDFERHRWTVKHFGQLNFGFRYVHSTEMLEESLHGGIKTNPYGCSSRTYRQSTEEMATTFFSSTLMSSGFANREKLSST